MIKINVEKTAIPIEIGDLMFEFDITDKAIDKFRENALSVEQDLMSLDADQYDNKDLGQVKEVLRKGYDTLLGVGAFDQVYKLSPSVSVMMNYFIQITDGIQQQMSERVKYRSEQSKERSYFLEAGLNGSKK